MSANNILIPIELFQLFQKLTDYMDSEESSNDFDTCTLKYKGAIRDLYMAKDLIKKATICQEEIQENYLFSLPTHKLYSGTRIRDCVWNGKVWKKYDKKLEKEHVN